jgi:hypothetical protein
MSPTTQIRLKRLAKLVGLVGGIVTLCLALGGAVWTAAADRATIRDRGQANQAHVADHETRLRVLERDLPRIGTDVRWIRETMEKKR